jgi:hypothetical protein
MSEEKTLKAYNEIEQKKEPKQEEKWQQIVYTKTRWQTRFLGQRIL